MDSGRRTLIALGLAGVLGLGYGVWFKQIQPGLAKEKEDAKLLFPGLGVDQTSRILLRKKGSKDVTLQKTGTAWRLVTPMDAPADEEAVKQLVQELSLARNEEAVVDQGAQLREFGLEEPSGAVTFLPSTPGAKAQVLFFGSENPQGTHAYAMVDGKPAVFLTPLGLKNAVLKDADGLREKRLWHWVAEDVEWVRSPTLKIEKDKRGQWVLSGQGRKAAPDPKAFEAWLHSLAALRAEAVPSEDGRGPYGLPGNKKFEVGLKAGKALFLSLGWKIQDKGIYVQTGGQGPVYQLGEPAAKTLQRSAKELMVQNLTKTAGAMP